MKRKSGRMSVLFLTTMILAVSVEALAETSWPTNLDEQKWSFEKAREWGDFACINKDSIELVIGLNKEKEDTHTRLSHLISDNGGKVLKTISTKEEVLAIVVEMPFDSVVDLVKRVKTAGLAEYIEPNLRVRPEFVPNDPYWTADQWGPKKIEADWAWNATVGSSDILVAIIDSGIDYNHPDLAANYDPRGYDWVNNDPYPMDYWNHGTHVAGIIAAVTNNGIGIAGLAQVKVMAEKVFNNSGGGSVDDVVSGIYHATDQGAQIISMSFTVDQNVSSLCTAVKYAYGKNVLLVAAAGNEKNNTKRYPAAYEEVIAVTATYPDDTPTWSTNYGDWVELAAPGFNINSTARGGYYQEWSGTSFACPHVSGLAALVWSEFPSANRDWVRARLRETADDLGDPGFDIFYGYGRINARKAIYGTSPASNYTLTITTTAGGTTDPAPGNYTHSEGQSVSVRAMPNSGYPLAYWELDGSNAGSNNPYSVLMENDHILQAVFAPINYSFVIAATSNGTTDPGPGIYNCTAGSSIEVLAIPNTDYTLDYWELDSINIGKANPLNLIIEANYTLRAIFRLKESDIAVIEILLSKTIVGQDYSTNIEVTIANQGNVPETFNVTVYANTTSIETQIVTLESDTSTTLTFRWNTTGFVKGNYTISAYVWPVQDETDTTDNSLTDGWVILTMVGDISGFISAVPDGKVDMIDIWEVSRRFGSSPGFPGYNPNMDIDYNQKIDMIDIWIVAREFGKIDP